MFFAVRTTLSRFLGMGRVYGLISPAGGTLVGDQQIRGSGSWNRTLSIRVPPICVRIGTAPPAR
jgi:hypothetical protein